MAPRNRRDDRKSSGRGPILLRFDRLEGRQLLTGDPLNPVEILPAAVAAAASSAESSSSASDATTSTTVVDTAATASATASPSATTTGSEAATSATATATAAPSPTASTSSTAATSVTTTAQPATAKAAPTTTSSATTASSAATAASTPGYTVLPGVETSSQGGLVTVKLKAPANLDWDQTFRLTGSIRNNSPAPTATAAQVQVFASPGLKTSNDSVQIGSFTVPAGIASGALYNFDVTLRTPSHPTTQLVKDTSYYITTNVGNTASTSPSLGVLGADASKVTITVRQPSKLVAAGISVSPGASDWGQTLVVTSTIHNDGPGDAPPTNARIIMVPYGEDPMGSHAYTIGAVPIPEVKANQTVTASQGIRLPYSPPTALANVSKFTVYMVSDADGLADPVITPTDYKGQGIDWTTVNLTARPAATPVASLPDVAAASLTTPTTIAWDQTIQTTLQVKNVGAGDAGTFKVQFRLVESSDPGAPSLVLAETQVAGLKAGETQDLVQSIKLPATPPAGMKGDTGSGRIIAVVDPDQQLDEDRTRQNNSIESPAITLKLVARDGTTTPVVTTMSDPQAPQPASNGTKSVAPTATVPGATSPTGSQAPTTTTTGTNTVTIPLTRGQKLRQSRAARQAALKAAREARQAALAELRVQARKVHTIPVAAHKRQMRVLASKPLSTTSPTPKQPA